MAALLPDGLSGAPLHADEVNVILIGGQSNATGQGYVNNIPSCFKTDKRILLYYSGSLKGTEPAEQLVPLSPHPNPPTVLAWN